MQRLCLEVCMSADIMNTKEIALAHVKKICKYEPAANSLVVSVVKKPLKAIKDHGARPLAAGTI